MYVLWAQQGSWLVVIGWVFENSYRMPPPGILGSVYASELCLHCSKVSFMLLVDRP